MSSSNPPYPNFNGITYNSSFFPTESSALTQGQANLLYLRKKTADTATALETFNAGINTTTLSASGSVDITGGLIVTGESTLTAGILTDTINSLTAASSMSFGSDNPSRTGNTNIGASNVNTKIFIDTSSTANTNNNPAISIGTSTSQKTIKIGNSADATSSSVHLSQLDIKGTQLNNIVNTTGNVDIATLQTTGILNIGSAVRTGTGVINIGTLSRAPINIGTSATAIGTSIVTIGGTNTGTTIGGTLGITGITTASGGLLTNTIDTTAVGTLTIGGTNCNAITFSDSVGATTFTGTINVAAITSATAGSNLALGGTQTGGVIQIGAGSTRTGAINLGSGTNTGAISLLTTTGDINIGSEQTTGDIFIGCNAGRTLNGQINIGTLGTNVIPIAIGQANSTTALNGATTISSVTLSTAPTLSYTTLPSFTTSQIGYYTNSAEVPGTAISATGNFTYTPAVGVASLRLPPGSYIASLFGIAKYTGTITSTAIEVKIGMASSLGTATNSTGTLAPFTSGDSVVAYPVTSSINTDQVFYPVTLGFTVDVLEYYYGCMQLSIGGLTGGTVQAKIRLVSLTRIA